MKPKICNIHKFRLILMESVKLKRLKKIRTLCDENLKAVVTLLSVTFSRQFLDICESPLVIENCNDMQYKKNWMNLSIHFVDTGRVHSLFSPLCLKLMHDATYLKVKLMRCQGGSLTVTRMESNRSSYRNIYFLILMKTFKRSG